MQKRWLATGLVAMIAVALVVVLLAQRATPVSAQLILERATAAQSASATHGIVHERVDSTQNISASSDPSAAQSTSAESYNDLDTGYVRWTVRNTATGQVLNAFAYDGTYTYSAAQGDATSSNTPLTIYRNAQRPDKLADASLNHSSPLADAKQFFDNFRSGPDVQLKGEETLADGRQVYILTSQEATKVISGGSVTTPMATTTVTFDAQTYQMLEVVTEAQKEGGPVTITSQRYVANEILPAGTPVAWDLSDLSGVSIVDDPNGQHGDTLPEKISEYDLVSHVKNPYVLAPTPDGFTQEISAQPNQPADQPYAYVITYRNGYGDYFVIQPGAEDMRGMLKESADEVYQTAAGLTLYFQPPLQAGTGKTVTSATVIAPDGTMFMVTSTLARERVKALAEDLIQSKG